MPSNVSLQGIEFTIKGSADEASKSVKQLTQELNELKDALRKSEGIGGLATSLKKFENINTTMLSVAGTILKEISQLDFTNIREAAEGIKDIAAAARQVAGIGSKDVPLEQVIGEPDKFRTALSYVQQLGHAFGTTLKVGIQGAALAAKGIGNILATPFRSAVNHVKKFGEGLSNVVSSLKRIAFYRIIRGVIKAITQAFQEGLKNAYEFSKATGDQAGLANALDTLATKSLTMKNQLGAAFGGLLTAITPIVIKIIGWVTKLAEALSRLMAILGGSNTYLKAKDVWTEWGEAAAGAGGAAKKALEYLAPFDELNVLPDPKSGGGGGGSAANIGDMFEYVNTSEGNGFLDTIKDMLDKVSNFFETTNWRELADKAWQKLKESFSDNGKATEVLKSLFEALGAAIGGVSAFIIEFARNLWEDVTAKFKSNLRDYNGDNKITVTDFLVAVFKTGVDVAEWVYDTIVKPLFDGFGRAMTNDPDFDFSEWAITHIVNPMIEAWNGLVTNLINPIITAINDVINYMNENWGANIKPIKLMGTVDTITIGDDVETGDGLVWQNRTKHFASEFNADVTSATDSIPYREKTIDVDGNITSLGDSLSAAKKVVNGITAGLTAAKDNIPASQKNIKSVADVGTWYNNISNSNYKGSSRPFISSVANVGSWYNNISNSNYKGTCRPFIPSVANMGSWYNNISNSTYNGGKSPFIYSVANMGDYKNNLGTPSINSSAYINGYRIDSSIRYYGDLSVSAYLNIKGQTNTPTVAVNAYYTNQTRAKGGAYYGSMWHDIPQYASGGRPHGSLFLAGEAGPEVVGHVGGRTEVLNRSQLAATMYSAVRSAMASTGFRISASPNPSYNTAEGTGNEDALYRAFRRALDETDFGGDVELDGQTLYRAMVNRNRQNTRLTGVNAMA